MLTLKVVYQLPLRATEGLLASFVKLMGIELAQYPNAARRTHSQFKGAYAGLVIRRGHQRTLVALGHKILRIVYTLLKTQSPYRDPGVDYEAPVVHRNAPRWIQALKMFGYWPQPLFKQLLRWVALVAPRRPCSTRGKKQPRPALAR